MQTVTTSWLKNIELLNTVPDEQLQWLIDHSEHYELPTGEFLFVPDKVISGTHFIIEGKLLIYTNQNGSRRELGYFDEGDITGYLPYSRGKVSFGYAVAVSNMQLMTFPIGLTMELIKNHFELTQALVHVMSDRVREYTALQQQNEKMMALGKLSAGLTHELNNPASAIVRDSMSLKKHLHMQPEAFKQIIGVKMNPDQVEGVTDKLFKVLSVTDHPRLTLKQRTEREGQISDWLDDYEVENAYDLAENFTEFNFTTADLDDFKQFVPDAYLSPIFNWINNVLVTEKMVEDIRQSSQRIAELVKSVKNFTHMDRAQDMQYADIHDGIANTLTMLGYKVRKGNITVVKEYDETLPKVKAFIGELNQVWTNLIDNALDAMEAAGKGILTIKTHQDSSGCVCVSIIDDGTGIPEDVQSRIFDPFFTTKQMGKGTGMGLEVVQRIVSQHNGSVSVNSKPGHTAFTVCFPING
jgi:signal transduction histidine kinase